MVVNYTEACVYKIHCLDPDIKDVYVGSTTNFIRRKNEHKSRCNNPKGNKSFNIKVYKFIRENGGWENWIIEVLDNVDCEDKKELHKYEREWFEKLKATLNKRNPSRTKEEYSKTYNKKKYFCKDCDKQLSYCNKSKHENTEKHNLNVIKKSK